MSEHKHNRKTPRILVLGQDWQPHAFYAFPKLVKNLFDGDVVALDKWKIPYNFTEWAVAGDTGWARWKQFSQLLLEMNPTERGLDWEFFHLVDGEKTPIAYPQVCVISHTVTRWKRARTKAPCDNGIILRDGFQCVYCGRLVTVGRKDGKFVTDTATIDHIIPLSKWDKWAAQHNPKFNDESWQNKVCACYECNHNKGNKLNEEIGYKLRVKPYMPLWHLHDGIRVSQSHIKESWLEYLYPEKMKNIR